MTALVALAVTSVAAERSDGWVVVGEGGVVIDWTRGIIVAPGAGAPDPRAPLGGIARVGAERIAERTARGKLERTVSALVAPDARPIGEQPDPAVLKRIARAIAGARRRNMRTASDGSTELSLVLPLEAIRTALAPPIRPQGAPGAPTAIVVDARGHKLVPMLGIELAAGDVSWSGPTVWHRSVRAAQQDERAGARVITVRLRSKKGRRLVLEMQKKSLARAQRAGSLVLIVTGETKP